jgi:hypothetical protein
LELQDKDKEKERKET